MTSKLVVNTIEADTGISSVSFASSISMNSTAKFHFSAAGVDIGADTNINRPAAGVLGFNINGAEKVRIDSSGHMHGVGVVTATHFYGDGSNLTSLPAQATIANNADNRVITGGSGVNLNGESNLTFTGSALNVVGTIDADDVISVDGSSNVDLRIQTSANNRLVLRGASSLSSIITHNNNNLSFRHDGGTGGGTEIFSMDSGGIVVGNNKSIEIKDYYGDVSGRIENSDSTNNSLRIDVDPDDSGASSVFMVRIDGNEKIRLNHNGQFGIGMNDPAATLHVGGGADTNPQVRIQRTSGYNNAWKIYQSHYAASDYGTLFLQPTLATTPNVEITNAAGAMAMRVDSDTGVISVKSGGGIDFSAYSISGDQGTASSTVLDDFEEGDWTCTLSGTGGGSITASRATYTKVGNMVMCEATFVNPGSNSVSGNWSMTLPFQFIGGGSGSYGGGQVTYTRYVPALTGGFQSYCIFTYYGQGSCYLRKLATNGSSETSAHGGSVHSSMLFSFTMTYTTGT